MFVYIILSFDIEIKAKFCVLIYKVVHMIEKVNNLLSKILVTQKYKPNDRLD